MGAYMVFVVSDGGGNAFAFLHTVRVNTLGSVSNAIRNNDRLGGSLELGQAMASFWSRHVGFRLLHARTGRVWGGSSDGGRAALILWLGVIACGRSLAIKQIRKSSFDISSLHCFRNPMIN